MFDIHSHVIFGVDDGPKTLEESLDLIRVAYDQGVRHIVATSHRRKGMFETPEETILKNFILLNSRAANRFPDLTLSYGGELHYTSDMLDKLGRELMPTMNGTRFILLEFSGVTTYKDMHKAVNQVLTLGYTPIIAHIERYQELAFEHKRVRELIAMGAYTQINSVHVLKPKLFGDDLKEFKKRARFFLDKDLVHCVASDMHNTHTRPPYMAEAYDVIATAYGENRARELFITNPQTLLDNQYI